MTALMELAERWMDEADTLRTRYGMEIVARLCEAHATELRGELLAGCDEILSVREASRESGYSTQHLRALIADGAIPNAGVKGRPRVRRGDLPTKGASSDNRPRHPRSQIVHRRAASHSRPGFDARRLVRGDPSGGGVAGSSEGLTPSP